MKISTYIFLSFLFILMMFTFTTYMNIRLSRQVQENADYFSTSSETMKLANRFHRNVLNSRAALAHYLQTGETQRISIYDTVIVDNQTIIKDLFDVVYDTTQLALLKDIEVLNTKWTNEYAQPLREAKRVELSGDSSKNAYRDLYNRIYKSGVELEVHENLQQRFKKFSDAEYAMREQKKAFLTQSLEQTKEISVALTVLSLITGFAVVTFVIRRITNRIKKMVKLANDIASGNYKTHIQDYSNDELSSLSESLNHMSTELDNNISLLKSKNEELDQFAHIVSHDLKGPLRGIDNVISWIEEDHEHELSPKLAEYLQLIKGRVTRTENLIQGILSYARIDKEEIQKEPVNVNSLMIDVVDSIPTRENVKVTWDNLPELFTEKVPLFQVLSNLVSNSIKYNDKKHGVVHVYAVDKGNHYEFFVQDNGPGIAENYHNRIFVIFQTLKERDSFESTGVGLAIVKKVLDGRKETIKVKSEVNKGATFSFTWSKN